VLPRLIAIALAGVVLYPLATTAVLLSSFAIASAAGDQRFAISVWSMIEYMDAGIVLQGLLRLAVFSTWIGVASCWFGRLPGVDARAVGGAVFAASVTSLGGIVVLNLALSFVQGTE
jgi:ABC-type transporter Mla maintaining outer membrane lipid asymmetry permease subunit MlaE